MARRRVRVSADRCWAYVIQNVEMSYEVGVVQQTTDPLIAFAEIEPTEAVLSRERSEFYFERLIIWWRPYFIRSSLLQIPEPMCTHRIGVLQDQVDLGLAGGPEGGADSWGRILQEEVIWNKEVRPYNWDGGAISVSTEATADFQGYMTPLPTYKWDLSSKFRLQEDSSLVWQIASSPDMGGETGHTFGVDVVIKALLRRGR